MNVEDQRRQAIDLFEKFHGRLPRGDELVKVGGLAVPTVGLEVGHFVGIGYKSLGDGKDYFHEFSKLNRPLIYVNPDGRQIYILKGGYRFSERGFLG